MAGLITWYDILGILPGASAEEVRSACEARMRQVSPQTISGAPSKVIKAADRARAAAEEAWRVLGDPSSRERYEVEAGIRRKGSGLERPQPIPSGPEWDPLGWATVEADIALAVVADWLAPQHRAGRSVSWNGADSNGFSHSKMRSPIGRPGVSAPCPDCGPEASGRRCDDHARDLELITEYQQTIQQSILTRAGRRREGLRAAPLTQRRRSPQLECWPGEDSTGSGRPAGSADSDSAGEVLGDGQPLFFQPGFLVLDRA
jgi:curved DNA-binding protein CbpA